MAATPRTVEQTNFDAIAGIYDDVFPPHIIEHYLRRRASYVLRHAATQGQSVLDVGAGTGLLADRLSELGHWPRRWSSRCGRVCWRSG